VLAHITTGDAITVELPLQGGRALRGRIDSIGHGGQGAGRLFPVVVELPDDDALVPGVTAELVISRTGAAGVTVPVSSIVDAGDGETTVFVIEDGLASRRRVVVGQLVGSRALVLEGLDPAQEVITGGHFGLVPGRAVQVQR